MESYINNYSYIQEHRSKAYKYLWHLNMLHRLALLLCFLYMGTIIHAQRKTTAPNIILIYVDDLGYSDLNCYGKQYGADFIETPYTNRLASQSMKFTNAYAAAPLCSPSRAALLTGKTPARLNFEFVTRYPNEQYKQEDTAWTNKFKNRPLTPPPYTLNLPLEEETIAEMLKGNGYNTAIAGKWHVASHYKVYNGWNPEFGPAKQGFDWTINTMGAWSSATRSAKLNAAQGEIPRDALTDEAISYIKQKHNKPFFLYMSHYYVHDPLDTALKWMIEKYQQKAKRMGLQYTDKRIQYAAFVETFDYYIGQLMQAIDDANLDKNTIVILTSDNGGMPEFAYNRPLRGSKWNLYEGGIRVPLLIRYPGVVQQNSVCNSPVMQTDFFPLFYELASGKKYNNTTIDGVSILPLLQGKKTKNINDRSLFWHFPYYHATEKLLNGKELPIGTEDGYISLTSPQSAIQKGNYKLIYFYEDAHVELYNLKTDIAEQTDISKIKPELAKKLTTELLNYLSNVNARLPKRK